MDYRRGTVITITLKAKHGSIYTEEKPESVHFFRSLISAEREKAGVVFGV